MGVFHAMPIVFEELFRTRARARNFFTMEPFAKLAIVFIFSISFLFSDETALQPSSNPATTTIKEKTLSENQSITVHGQKILYDIHGGAITFKNKEGKESADIYFIAYFAKPSDEKKARPIAFCFNGGPASSSYGSIWAF